MTDHGLDTSYTAPCQAFTRVGTGIMAAEMDRFASVEREKWASSLLKPESISSKPFTSRVSADTPLTPMSAVFSPGEVPDLERFLTYRLHLVNKLSDRDTSRAYLDECGMALGEARCLAAIGRFAPLSVNDLARAANLDKGHASRSAQALVQRGLVHKTVSESDGRGVVLTATTQGLSRYRDVIALIERRNHQIFGCLSPDEQDQLVYLLDRVIAGQRAQAGAL